MKLLRYGPPGSEKPGLLDADGKIRDLSANIPDLTVDRLSDENIGKLKKLDPRSLPLVNGSPRLGIPVAGIRQCVAIGLNYRKHAVEANLPIPEEPVIFFKAITSLSGPNDDIVLPPKSQATDWEIELAIIIGRTARRVSEAQALEHVAGYAIANDVSERDWQIKRSGQWSKGKSFDSFCPLGPWLVTRDELTDPQALGVELSVNGTVKQSSTTADMIFSCAHIVSYVSQFMTLLAGDVIITGTPGGVGVARKPQEFLHAGDKVRLKIDRLGEQTQRVAG